MRIACCLVLMLVMLLFPDSTGGAARSALSTWALSVVPSLFPYMVLCRMLASQLAGIRLPPALLVASLGLVGGSPSGAAMLSGYARSGRLRWDELPPLCALTGTISPIFVLNTAGGWLGEPFLARCLLAAHLLGAALSAAMVKACARRSPSSQEALPGNSDSVSPGDPIRESVRAILSVGGCIVFYSVVAEGLSLLLPLPEKAAAVLHGALEAAGGVRALCTAGFSKNAQALLTSAMLGFSGVSILAQNSLFVRDFGVTMRELVLLGLLRAALSALLMAAFLCIV